MLWEDLFEDLKERVLKGVKSIVSDSHKGIQNIQGIFYWIKLADVSRTSDNKSIQKGTKKEQSS
jgi:hypothetical protein